VRVQQHVGDAVVVTVVAVAAIGTAEESAALEGLQSGSFAGAELADYQKEMVDRQTQSAEVVSQSAGSGLGSQYTAVAIEDLHIL